MEVKKNTKGKTVSQCTKSVFKAFLPSGALAHVLNAPHGCCLVFMVTGELQPGA